MKGRPYDRYWSPGEKKPPIEAGKLGDLKTDPKLLIEKIERLERLQRDAPDDPVIAQSLADTQATYEKIYGSETADQTTDNSNP